MHIFGFTSWKQFFKIATGVQYKNLAILDIAVALQLALLSMVHFIDTWVWSPPYSLIVYFVLLGADFLSGVAVGMKVKKEGFLTAKGQRIFIIFPAHLIILGVLFNAGRINADLGIQQIGDGVFTFGARAFYFYVMGINLISFAKNLALLGMLPPQAAEFLAKYVDKNKNMQGEGILEVEEEKILDEIVEEDKKEGANGH